MKRFTWKKIVCALLITATLMAPVSASASSVARIMKVSADWARMRSIDGEEVARLRKGTKVLYWGAKEDQMLKVMTSNGKTGYVYKDYLSLYGAMKKSAVHVTTKSTKMYKASGSSLKRNGTLSKGKYVVVYKTSGDWAFIKTMSGKSAYVKKANLKKAF